MDERFGWGCMLRTAGTMLVGECFDPYASWKRSEAPFLYVGWHWLGRSWERMLGSGLGLV